MMSDDQTVQLSTYFPLTVQAAEGVLHPWELRFIHSFRIGRSEECEVRCVNRSVSRIHVDVLFENGRWWVQDHQSRNGTFVEGEKIERLCLTGLCKIKLGKDGPIISLQIENLLDNTAISTPTSTPEKGFFQNSSSPVSLDTRSGDSSSFQDDSEGKSGVVDKSGNLPGLFDSQKELPGLSSLENPPTDSPQEHFDHSKQPPQCSAVSFIWKTLQIWSKEATGIRHPNFPKGPKQRY